MAILTTRTALTAPASGDLVHIVDVSDTTDNAAGTSKKITADNLSKAINLDNVPSGTTNKVYTATEQTKLAGIATSANNYVHPNHSGDVTSVADGAQTIADGAVTLAKMANMATSSLIYRKTASSGVPEVNTLATLKTDLGLTGTNSGDQTISLTGDVTGSGTGSFAATIADKAVTLAKMNDLAQNKIIGRVTASTGVPEALTAANVRTIINVADGATADAKATGAELDTGTDDAKFATAKALKDSHNVPSVAPSTSGNIMTSNGTDWVSSPATGGGDMVLASVQSVTGLKTFDKQKLAMKGTSTGVTTISTANASGTDYTATLQAATGTIAYTSDITGTNSGTNTGDQTITLQGDVTGTGTGTFTATIANDAVTYAKMQNVSATDKVLGRTTAGSGDVEEIATTGSGNVVRATSATLVTPLLGTPTSGTLTNCTGLPIAGLTASTSTALGVGSIELGHATDTTITRTGAGAIAVEGTAVLLSGGALGTPSSGTLTNATGLPVAGITASTSTALGVGSIELGHATDTTIARVSAGVASIEGKNILTTDGGTLTGNITLGENTSIALDPAGSADGKYSGITVTGTGGATIAFGDLVTLDKDDSRWELVDISVAAAATGDARGLIGVAVTTSTDGNPITVLLMGQVRADANFPALTIGAPVYASTTGDIVVSQPTTTDHVIRIVGYALTADEIVFLPAGTWTTHT